MKSSNKNNRILAIAAYLIIFAIIIVTIASVAEKKKESGTDTSVQNYKTEEMISEAETTKAVTE